MRPADATAHLLYFLTVMLTFFTCISHISQSSSKIQLRNTSEKYSSCVAGYCMAAVFLNCILRLYLPTDRKLRMRGWEADNVPGYRVAWPHRPVHWAQSSWAAQDFASILRTAHLCYSFLSAYLRRIPGQTCKIA